MENLNHSTNINHRPAWSVVTRHIILPTVTTSVIWIDNAIIKVPKWSGFIFILVISEGC